MRQLFWMFLAISFGQSFAAFGGETKEFDSAPIKKLQIANPKGEILVNYVKNSKKIVVSIDKIEFDSKCKFILSASIGVLKIAVENENAIFDKANCVSKLKINIPNKSVGIDVTSGTASIKIEGVDGTIDFKTATGAVEINAEALKNITGKTATGNMRLSFNNCPSRADIDLVSATGDAEIRLPSQCKIKVNHKSATGELFNELGDSEDYQVLISSKSAGGGLKVRKLTK
jgi:hypothetical protein